MDIEMVEKYAGGYPISEYQYVPQNHMSHSEKLRVINQASNQEFNQGGWATFSAAFCKMDIHHCIELVRSIYPPYSLSQDLSECTCVTLAVMWLNQKCALNGYASMQTLVEDLFKLDLDREAKNISESFFKGHEYTDFAKELPLSYVDEDDYQALRLILENGAFATNKGALLAFSALIGFSQNDLAREITVEALIQAIFASDQRYGPEYKLSWRQVAVALEIMGEYSLVCAIRNKDKPKKDVDEVTPTCKSIQTWKVYSWMKSHCCISSNSVSNDESQYNCEYFNFKDNLVYPKSLLLEAKMNKHNWPRFQIAMKGLDTNTTREFLLCLSELSKEKYQQYLKEPNADKEITGDYLTELLERNKIGWWSEVIFNSRSQCTWKDAVKALNDIGARETAIHLLSDIELFYELEQDESWV